MKNIYSIILLFTLSSCYNQDKLVDKKSLLRIDYRLYQSTPAWRLAKAVEVADTVEIKEEIIQKKVPVDYLDPLYGHTLLMFAIYHSQYESVKMLLKLGANPNLHDKYDGTTPVIYASRNYESKYLKLILSYKGDPNSREFDPTDLTNPDRDVPLTAAISFSEENQGLEKVKLLIEAGADIEYSNKDITISVLAKSLITGEMDIAMYLLQKGADYRKPMYFGQNVSILYVLRTCIFDLDSKEYREKMKIVDFLKSKGLDYDKEPIPNGSIQRIKNKYPNNWKEYKTKY